MPKSGTLKMSNVRLITIPAAGHGGYEVSQNVDEDDSGDDGR